MYVPLTLKLQAMHAPEFASLGICRMAERRFLHREQSLRRGKRVEDIVGGMTAAMRLLLALVYLLALPVWANQSLDLLAPPNKSLGNTPLSWASPQPLGPRSKRLKPYSKKAQQEKRKCSAWELVAPLSGYSSM